MAASVKNSTGIITFSASDEIADTQMNVEFILLAATAAGAFVIEVGEVPMTLSTTAEQLVLPPIPVNRTVRQLKVTSAPTGGVMYAFIKKK